MRKFTLIALLALSACGSPSSPDGAEPTKTTYEDIAADENVSVTDSLATEEATPAANGGVEANASEPKAEETAAAQDWTKTVSRTSQGGYRMGNPQAKVKLVEYGARTCPACGQFARDGMKKLATTYVSSGNVSYEFRDFMVHGIPDVAATLVGQCGTPATFFPILEATYANQQKSLEAIQKTPDSELEQFKGKPISGFLTYLAQRGGYVEIAERNGLAKGRAATCLADEKAAQRLVDQTNAAAGSVDGTPAFTINGKKVDGHDWQAVEKALKAAGA